MAINVVNAIEGKWGDFDAKMEMDLFESKQQTI